LYRQRTQAGKPARAGVLAIGASGRGAIVAHLYRLTHGDPGRTFHI
jgi:hypothetical protein